MNLCNLLFIKHKLFINKQRKRTNLIFYALIFAESIVGQISGTVFLDYNSNGIRSTLNPNEPLYPGIIVTAFDASGVILASYTTNSSSLPNYTIPNSGGVYNGILGSNTGFVSAGTAIRIEFTNFPSYVYSSANGSNNFSSIQFVTAPSSTTSFAISNPGDFYTPNPLVITPRYINGNNQIDSTTLVGIKYDESGLLQKLSNAVNIGSTWGLAYKPDTKTIFASSLLKRHHGFGPGVDGIYGTMDDISTIYVFNNYSGSGLGAVSYKINVNTFPGVDVGANPRVGASPPNDLGASNTPSHDFGVYGNEGKIGMGDIDISEDGKLLYILNLKTPSLVVLNVTNPISPTFIGNYPIPKPTGAPLVDTYRPWAIGINNGKVYIGGVMSGDNTQDTTLMRAYVQEFNGSTFSNIDIDGSSSNDFLPLNYNRTSTYFYQPGMNWINSEWRPWTDVIAKTFPPGRPQPILSDIDFTENSSMILTFMDRNGLQVGIGNYSPDPLNMTLYSAIIGGDIKQFCNIGNIENPIFFPEGASGCTQSVSPDSRIDSPSDPPDKRYYNTVSISNPNSSNFEGHAEIPHGGLAYLKGSNSLVITAMNPEDKIDNPSSSNAYFCGGLRWFSSAGTTLHNYTIYNSGGSATTPPTQSKSVGLGDIELISNVPTMEIGNRVWLDSDKDGIQDAGEAGIANVTINLFADFNLDSIPDGPPLGTVITSNSTGTVLGTWYFNSSNVIDGDPEIAGNQAGPQPNKNYLISIDNSDWSGVGVGDLSGLILTSSNIGGPVMTDFRDNDGVLIYNVPTISYLTGVIGENVHTLDFGFFEIPPCPNPNCYTIKSKLVIK